MNIHGKCAFKRAHTHARTHKERRMRLSPPGWREFFRDKPGNCVAQFPSAPISDSSRARFSLRFDKGGRESGFE